MVYKEEQKSFFLLKALIRRKSIDGKIPEIQKLFQHHELLQTVTP